MKKTIYWQWLALLLAGVVVIFSNCDSCNPATSSIGYICTEDIGGSTYAFQTAPGNVPPVNFEARIYYSSLDSTCQKELPEGEHPLVVFGHGRYGSGAGSPNYLGATNLMHHLASWGYICVSVNLDVVWQLNSSTDQWGIPHRGELLLHAVDYMLTQNGDPGSQYHNRIDTGKIALIGHSRGGGGATYAVNLNQSQGSPRNIGALATISPTDFGTSPTDGTTPQLMLFGTWDGDLSDAQGYHLWDPISRGAVRSFVEIHGANHFHFTDAIDYSREKNEISRALHHRLSKGFINAFFDEYLRGLDRYDWPAYTRGEELMASLDSALVFIQYLHDDILVVDNGSPTGTPNTNNLGAPNDGSTLVFYDDRHLSLNAEHQFGDTDGLRATWDAEDDRLVVEAGGRSAAAFTHLAFRTSQRHGVTQNTADEYKNWTVRLTDVNGMSDEVEIIDYHRGLQYPDFADYPVGHWHKGSVMERKNIPVSFRIPLSDFPEVDLNGIATIEFLFDQPDGAQNGLNYDSDSGAITLDDIEFTK